MNTREQLIELKKNEYGSVPELNGVQLDLYTRESLHVQEVGAFDPGAAVRKLEASEGKEVIALDIGGDTIAVTRYEVQDGALTPVIEIVSGPTKAGKNYLSVMEGAALSAQGDNLPVGISFAGPTEGIRPIAGPNVSELMEELSAYGGNFKEAEGEGILYGEHLGAVSNDAVAGLYAGALEAARQNPNLKNVIYLINGSGIGGAVLKNGQIFAVEPGHVPVVEALNPTGRTESCGMFDQVAPCTERVAGGKAGIEATWYEQTGEVMGGREIAEKARRGDQLAVRLYNNAAAVTANVIVGMATAMDIPLDPNETAFVCHGGVFKYKEFSERMKQILEKSGSQVPVLLTHEFSENACIEGAAVAALMNAA